MTTKTYFFILLFIEIESVWNDDVPHSLELKPINKTIDPEAYPVIQNLAEMLSPLWKNNGPCVLMLNNFRSTNLLELNYPIILRTPKPADISHKNYLRKGTKGSLWTQKDELLENKCKISYFLSGIHLNEKPDDDCLTLELALFASRTKPWACQAHVHMYVPHKDVKKLRIIGGREHRTHRIPTVIPDIQIVVDLMTEKSQNWQLFGYDGLYRYSTFYVPTFYSDIEPMLTNDIVIAMKVNQYTRLIDEVSAKKLSKPHHTTYLSFIPKVFNISFWINITMKELLHTKFPGLDDIVIWHDTFMGSIRYQSGILQHMRMCSNYYARAKSLAIILPFKDEQERLFHSYAHELQTIMGNYTYILEDNSNDRWKICVNGKIVKVTNYKEIGMFKHDIHPIQWHIDRISTHQIELLDYNLFRVNVTMSDLRFVSCGERGKSKFPFHELYNVYHYYVWCAMGTSVPLLVITFALISRLKNEKRLSHVIATFAFSTLKVLLEQNDPFPRFSIASCGGRLRWLVTAFSLTGIVLSNSYKNTNVYNMIIPRKSVLFETVQELVEGNFTIFTRVEQMFVPALSVNERDLAGTKFSKNFHRTTGRSVLVISEVYALRSYFESEDKFDRHRIIYLYNRTRLHPAVISIYTDIWRAIIPIRDINPPFSLSALWDTRSSVVKDICSEREMKVMWNDLKKCNKIALLLPQYKSKKIAMQLRTSGNPYGNVGKDVYMNTFLAINLDGMFMTGVVNRAKGLDTSGILQWWNDFHGKMDFKISEERILRKPTMNGNIIVIFIVLFTGLIFSSAFLIIECRKEIFKWMVWHILSLYFKCKKFIG